MKTSLDCDGTTFVGSEMLISFIFFFCILATQCWADASSWHSAVMKEFPSFHCCDWQIFYIRFLQRNKNILRHVIVGIFTIWVKLLCQNGKSYSTQTQVFAKKNLLTEREGTVELLQSTELLSSTTLIMKKRLHIIVF